MTRQTDKDGSGYVAAILMLCIIIITCSITVFSVGALDKKCGPGDKALCSLLIVWPYTAISIFTLLYQAVAARRMFKHKSANGCIVFGIIFLVICLMWLAFLLGEESLFSEFSGYYFILTIIQMLTLTIGILYSRMRKEN